MGVAIINGILSSDHVHMFVEIPPQVSVSDFVRRAKGRSSRKLQ
jgi:putative transposase